MIAGFTKVSLIFRKIMKKKLLLLCVILLHAHPGISQVAQTEASKISEPERQAVEAAATAFAARLQQTRDLAPLLTEFYLADFIKRNLPASSPTSAKFITLNFAPEIPIKPALIHQARLQDWQALYVNYQNLKYFMVLTIATLPEKRGAPQNEIFPPAVEKLLKSQAERVKSGIHTVKELRGLNAALEQACMNLRGQFIKQPPELAPTYQQRRGQFLAQHGNVMQAGVQVKPQADSGFPPETRFFNIVTDAPFFELRFVLTAAGLKILFARVYPYN